MARPAFQRHCARPYGPRRPSRRQSPPVAERLAKKPSTVGVTLAIAGPVQRARTGGEDRRELPARFGLVVRSAIRRARAAPPRDGEGPDRQGQRKGRRGAGPSALPGARGRQPGGRTGPALFDLRRPRCSAGVGTPAAIADRAGTHATGRQRSSLPERHPEGSRATGTAAGRRPTSTQLGKTFVDSIPGVGVDGVYRQAVDLASGRFALIEKSREFTLVPWRPALERHIGRAVSGMPHGDDFNWTIGRGRGGPSL